MKKPLLILTAALLALAAFGCAKQPAQEAPALTTPVVVNTTPEPSPEPAPTPENDPEPEEPLVGVPNPMEEYATLEELQDKIGMLIHIPYSAADPEYYLIAGELADVRYYYEAQPYQLRLKKTEALEDISGVYAEWDSVDTLTWEELEYSVSLSSDGTGLSQWYDAAAGYSYCIYMPENATKEALRDMTQSIVPVG